ncbi:MAG: YbeD family protein [Ostreibacterium sp.]
MMMNKYNNPDNQEHLLGDEGESASLIQFPERFPIKIFGADSTEFEQAIKAIITCHVDAEHLISWKQNLSSKGNFLAITVTIMAQSQSQLDAIYLDLTNNLQVKMAL